MGRPGGVGGTIRRVSRGGVSRSRQPPGAKLELAYAVLRDGIVDGTYAPGSRLVLEELARSLAMSPVPVREAVRRLEAEGYVEVEPNVGPRVASFDEAQYADAMHLLAVLEGTATALAAPHLRDVDLAELRRANAAIAGALDTLSPVQFSELNREFHFGIYARCPNPVVSTALETMWNRLDVFRRSAFVYAVGRPPVSVREHAALLDLIADGATADVIEQAARAHKLGTLSATRAGLAGTGPVADRASA